MEGPDIIRALYKDHARIATLVTRLRESRTPGARRRIVSQLDAEIRLHSRLERKLLYGPCRDAAFSLPERQICLEAEAANEALEQSMAPLTQDGSPSAMEARAHVLGGLIQAHLETIGPELFMTARRRLAPDELAQLGRAFQSARGGATRSGRHLRRTDDARERIRPVHPRGSQK